MAAEPTPVSTWEGRGRGKVVILGQRYIWAGKNTTTGGKGTGKAIAGGGRSWGGGGV